MSLNKIISGVGLIFLSGAILTGCADKNISKNNSDVSASEKRVSKLAAAKKVLETNADIALAAYSDSVDTAIALRDAIIDFKQKAAEVRKDPHNQEKIAAAEAAFEAAKKAWRVAREPYGQTEVYRFRLSPIDSTNYKDEDGPEGDINAWPLGEALIDYVLTGDDFGDDQVGVTENSIGDPIPSKITTANAIYPKNYKDTIIGSGVEINEDLIAKTVTAEDERDVISGYHAIEFMLWGQDLNEDGTQPDDANKPRDNTPGHRPLTDFTTDPNAERRFAYMEVVVNKLIKDLKQVRDGWKKGAPYREAFTSPKTQAEADMKIKEIFQGMGTLSEGELAGERMQIALVNNSQEDEHSCFSDNTHRDIWLNAEGVSNVWYGVYEGYDTDLDGKDDNHARAVKGYGLSQYIRTYGNPALADKLEQKLAATEAGYKAIDKLARTGTPFDLQIKSVSHPDAAKVKETILSLNAQAGVIQEVADDLGLGTVVDPEATECNTADPDSPC